MIRLPVSRSLRRIVFLNDWFCCLEKSKSMKLWDHEGGLDPGEHATSCSNPCYHATIKLLQFCHGNTTVEKQ
ncbi:hypothetical protein MPTK1_4g17470 [Marchantia polymorpha subsp. ruderalis]|uniref:Uncharacterized protein n=2 Tax=Marchantia polymorpha TaxID=3197 RepID=A0AAF6BAV5_MARPO|nr:hypothetical protein MARPO_0041s0029 [Marchantia polymorpha]BBN09139.1 hypothetical protein Mp_4g17470 [Marchantia polymorpha subsp. ruderalis]|eukprot:PTQ40127.1 hypothetical protein MARPO_0041s0029 [Marchantia polymorpha]